ncbi:hypothetical protein PENARI_c048G11836 [Penicillium arizonense]|uniref:PNPLA domain-containing protein n=1 Tax=Penicillium arizonense TaxID=1835702 RepID=A0A1F5L303_PENAI|nr:hypothetical protein PENARI_c048G11836 [Penicillium arizonense]OGE47359.1 hypothetical protein PENARI_c048G11836 [Penicillium arizonense]
MAAWLDILSDTTGRSLVDTGRFEEIVQGMSHPNSQYPSLVYFAGNGNRVKALQALFPRNNVTRKGPAGLIRVHLSTATAHTEHPIIFAESNPFSQAGVGDTCLLRWSGDRHRRYPLSLGESQPLADLQQEVIRQKILPWTQVLCFFVDTISEMQHVQQLLDAPIGTLSIGASHIRSMMRVVIVLSGDSQLEAHGADDGFELPNAWLGQHKLTILDLRDRSKLSPSVAFDPLRSLILDQIQQIRSLQKEKCLSFSAVHLNALWGRGLQLRMGSSNPASLDCLLVAREGFKRKAAMASCFVELQSQFASSACPENEVYSFIASALLMDAYPPEMHLFEPKTVFNALYRAHCWNVWEGRDPEIICNKIMHYFTESFAELSSKASADVADLFAGTSVGALSEVDIVLNGLSAEESCAKFPALARIIFGSPRFLADCQYDSERLEDTLQKVVDPQRRMFDVTTTSSTRCRVAIITSRTSDGKACVLANYRGTGQREVNAAYQFLIPKTEDENPHSSVQRRSPFVSVPVALKMVANNSSFFRSKSLPGFGSLQDGGVRANNPLAIALKESVVIWPSAKTHDLLLDLVKLVMVEFPGARFETARGHRLGDVDEDDGCHVCGYYRKKVAFSINGLHEMTSIGIASSSSFQRIGGFPKSVQELLDDQQANSHFGRADHLVASWPPKRNCYCSPRVKRHVQFLEPALINKKRRL